MSEQYAGDEDFFPADYTIPDDSDPPTAAAFNPAAEALGDRTAWLKKRVDALVPLTTLAQLTAIAAPASGLLRFVDQHGWYRFDSSATTAADGRFVLAADDSTPGRWRHGGVRSRRRFTAMSCLNPHVAWNPISTFESNRYDVVRNKEANFTIGAAHYQYGVGVLSRTDTMTIVNGSFTFRQEPGGPDGTYSHGAMWCLDPYLIEGATLEQVQAIVHPATSGRAALPPTPMSIGVFRKDVAGLYAPVSMRSAGDFANDPSATLVAYQTPHILPCVTDQHNVISKAFESYYVQVWNEFGAGTDVEANNRIAGFYILQSKAPDMVGSGDEF